MLRRLLLVCVCPISLQLQLMLFLWWRLQLLLKVSKFKIDFLFSENLLSLAPFQLIMFAKPRGNERKSNADPRSPLPDGIWLLVGGRPPWPRR